MTKMITGEDKEYWIKMKDTIKIQEADGKDLKGNRFNIVFPGMNAKKNQFLLYRSM